MEHASRQHGLLLGASEASVRVGLATGSTAGLTLTSAWGTPAAAPPALAHVAAGTVGCYVLIAHVAAGASFGADGVPKKENAGSFFLTGSLEAGGRGRLRAGLA
jgi:hypothetical protein